MSEFARPAAALMRCTRWLVVLAMVLGLIMPHHHDMAAAASGHAPAHAHATIDAPGGAGHDHAPASPDGKMAGDCCLQHAPCCALPQTASRFVAPMAAIAVLIPPAVPVLSDPLLDRLERPPRSAA
ncbi:hypothetical protein [Phreatobacter oligotrophus]|uniref:hypothetical protein n=1 Tax=Phreatobacter oligotrophus TaxID=1122261 RepID=UPI0023548BAC|nr:hypothetical protein [Phreatobacter oligotrophus]MBX9989662.1 hypothetical protein [Phreatobacter oligotrophus]